MDGIELAGRISLLMPATKRLFVTGLGGSDALGLFGFEQNDPVLAKPFSPFALLAAVDDVLHKHAL
jgi:CheY-like chemotaxis protein